MLKRSKWFLIVAFALVTFLTLPAARVWAGHTPNPVTVTITGSFQSELGAAGDWQPEAAVTQLTYDANDDVWQGTFFIPAGNWEYKAALNGSWDENYGLNATQNGANLSLFLAAGTEVKFYYDHKTHWLTDNINSIIATVPGSFQSELGSGGDWDPSGLRSWLQDPDGDGIYDFTADLPAGNYEGKTAINESWAENYGYGGIPGGANILITVPTAGPVHFSYDPNTHILTVALSETPFSDWYENWDSYATGQSMHGVNGWKGWDNAEGATAYTGSSRFICAPNSIEIQGNTDLVHEFSGCSEGVWRFTAWQYVPADFSGQTYFNLMNKYTDGGPYDWSTVVGFNGADNLVSNYFSGDRLSLIKGQWVELRVDIDLENNTQKFYYGGSLLYEASWTGTSGIANIAAVDLFANSSTVVFYDNLSLTEPSDSVIGWANLQWPPSLTVQAGTPTDIVYSQIWIDGQNNYPGAAAGLRAELGYGPQGSDPSGANWEWTEATFNTDVGNNEEFMSRMTVNSPGTYDYCFRYSYKGGLPVYADLNGPSSTGSSLANPGVLTVTPSSDTVPPSIFAPADITAEATGPDGAVVTFAATASDDVGPVTITYSQDPGTTFSLGITSVTCTAADGAGNTAGAVFNVNVVDTTPPELRVPADITLNATGSGGAVVNFIVTATDIVGLESLDVTPMSGTLFPIGSTIVNCTATDKAGNSAGASFTVTVSAIEVKIDVKPGDDLNNISLKGKGILPAAVLGSAGFDVSQINPDTVVFAGASPFHWSEPEDVNLDGIPDLVFQFKTQETNLAVGVTQATLGGLTSDGFYFAGSNMVQITK